MVPSLNNEARIEPSEEESAPANGANLPMRLFHCRLDDQPDHLVPDHYLRDWAREDLSDRPLFVNPESCFSSNGELPTMVANSAPLLDNFMLAGNMVWIQDSVRHGLVPFWLGTALKQAIAGLKPGDRASSALTSDALRVLAMADVLVPDDHFSLRSKYWNQVIYRCAAEFEKKRYTPIGQLIHPFHISALRRYYRHLIRHGRLTLGDSQSPRRYVAKDEPVARFFHRQLTATMSRIVEEPVKPSYVYLGSYQGGAALEAHIDREQCEFSISLCIDYSPEPLRESPWPLQLHTATGKTTVFQAIGDALIYSGREIPHSRDPLPLRNTSTSLFFHYVRESFTGPLI
ncbi:MAG TPA: hypothetical protein VH079_00145 [Terriglobales bacterium]|nr:hypothetical protein [Terriglobales bacterium]